MTVSEHYVTFHFSFRFVTNANQNFYVPITGMFAFILRISIHLTTSYAITALYAFVRLANLLRPIYLAY